MTSRTPAVPFVWVQGEERKNQRFFPTMMVDLGAYVNFDPEESRRHRVMYIIRYCRVSWKNAGD